MHIVSPSRGLLFPRYVREPYLSEFKQLVRQGAGTQTIDGAPAVPRSPAAAEARLAREVDRVASHLRGVVPMLEAHVGRAPAILDVGCRTGGSTVALALSSKLAPERVVGVDPYDVALQAAAVRARMHDVADRVTFEASRAGAPLPFEDEQFDLVTSVSVLEYVHRLDDRRQLVGEMKRVTKRGGHVFIATPSPFRLRDRHSGRLLGDIRRGAHPWASTPRQLESMLEGFEITWERAWQLGYGLRKLGLPIGEVPDRLGFLGLALPWQKVLARKPL